MWNYSMPMPIPDIKLELHDLSHKTHFEDPPSQQMILTRRYENKYASESSKILMCRLCLYDDHVWNLKSFAPKNINSNLCESFFIKKHSQEEFDNIASRIINLVKDIFPSNIILSGMHIGSTSIKHVNIMRPGMAIYINTHNLSYVLKNIEILELNGFFNFAYQETQGELWTWVKCTQLEGLSGVHEDIKVIFTNCLNRQWIMKRDFRDYLNNHPEEAKEYEALKLECSLKQKKAQSTYTNDLELAKHYSCNKGPFVLSILHKCGHKNLYLSPWDHGYACDEGCIRGNPSNILPHWYGYIVQPECLSFSCVNESIINYSSSKSEAVTQEELPFYTLVNHDPSWERLAYDEIQRLIKLIVLNNIPLQKIEHIGSTAIPDMISKPSIHIMVGVRKEDVDAVKDLVNQLGWVYFNGCYFGKIEKGMKYVLSVVDYGSTYWRGRILFRDHFINHPEDIEEYSNLKLHNFNADLTYAQYVKAKQPYICRILRQYGFSDYDLLSGEVVEKIPTIH